MDGLFIVMVGALVAAAVYLLLARDLPRVLIGFVLLGTGVNLAILAAGRVGAMVPPLVPPGSSALPDVVANPLPQALILTAIVIGFGLTAFALVLLLRAYERLGTVVTSELPLRRDVPEEIP